jgi:hypothetical protein
MTDQTKLFNETQAYIAKIRAELPDDCATAYAIDKNDAWGTIAAAARSDSDELGNDAVDFDDIADVLQNAEDEWEG